MKKRLKNLYKLESELCEVLAQYAEEQGWTVYRETSGWDLLLVKHVQIGVQAKLKDNVEVLSQAVAEGWETSGPHFRAVLVPQASQDFIKLARHLKIYTIMGLCEEFEPPDFEKVLKKKIGYNYPTMAGKTCNTILDIPESFRHNTDVPCWTPELKIKTPAGVKSPKIVTPWKIKAVKLCLKLKKCGHLTSQDFKDNKISIGLWVKKKWLKDTGEKIGRLTKYVRNSGAVLPDELYPEIVEAFVRENKE